MPSIEEQVSADLKKGYEVITDCTNVEALAIAKTVDIYLKDVPELTLSRMFQLLDKTKEYVLDNKTLKGYSKT